MACNHFTASLRQRRWFQRILLVVLGFHLVLGGGVASAQNGSYDGLVNLDDRASVAKGRYYFDRSHEEVRLTASISNTSGDPIRTPIVLAISNLPSNVSLSSPDGFLEDGTPYLDFTHLVSGGELLAAGATTEVRQVSFHCPGRARMRPTFAVWGQPPVSVTASASPTTGPIPLAVAFAATTVGNVVLYEWDFTSDGTYDSSSTTTPSATHTYSTIGTFTATIRVTDNLGMTATATVVVSTIAGLEARPHATPTVGTAPLTVYFSTDGHDPVGTIQIFRWDFDGNGSWDTYDTVARDYTHTYSTPGTYNATLYVQSSTGATATASIAITVDNNPPVATADVVPSNGEVPLTVQFTGSGSDVDGQIVLYEWDFDGDGTYDWSSTSSGNTVYTYTTVGTFSSVFRVTDNDGATDTAIAVTTVVRVGPPGSPTATASATPTTGQAPLAVSFSGSATDPDNDIVLYEWDFDNDGSYDWSSSSTASVSHTYTQAGSHIATFRVTDSTGLTGMDQIVVFVSITTSLSVANNTVGILGQDFINYCRLGGVVANASSNNVDWGSTSQDAIDGNPDTSWYSNYGDNPSYSYTPPAVSTFIEVVFPAPQVVSQVNVNGGSWWVYYGILRGRIELFNAADTVLYSEEVDISAAYAAISVPEISDVTRCRITVLAANFDYPVCSLDELEVGYVPAGGQFVNHCLLSGVVANASSDYYGDYLAANVIDAIPETYWVSAEGDTPGPGYDYEGDTFFEVVFASPQSVSQVNIHGGTWDWDWYGILSARIDLFDSADVLLFSQEVDLQSLYSRFPIAEVQDVTRCRLTVLEARVDPYEPMCCLGELEVGRVPTTVVVTGTTIDTSITAATSVSVEIRDADGATVRTIVGNEFRDMGSYSDYWDCQDNDGFLVNDGLHYAILRYEFEGAWHELDLTYSTGGNRYSFPFGSGCNTRDHFTNGFEFSPFEDEVFPLTFRLCNAQEVTAFMGPLWGGADPLRYRTIVNRKAFPAGESTVLWDGLTDQGEIAHDPNNIITGFWRYNLPDNAIYMTGARPVVTNVSADTNYFSPFSEKCDPDGNDEGVTISYTVSEDVQFVELRVYTVETSALLKTFTEIDVEAGEQTIFWDGKNNNDEYVDIGDYRVGLVAVDGDGNESMLRYTLVRLDY